MRIIFKQVNFKFKNLKSILLTNFPTRKRNLNSFSNVKKDECIVNHTNNRKINEKSSRLIKVIQDKVKKRILESKTIQNQFILKIIRIIVSILFQ